MTTWVIFPSWCVFVTSLLVLNLGENKDWQKQSLSHLLNPVNDSKCLPCHLPTHPPHLQRPTAQSTANLTGIRERGGQ